jgi:cation diffusion facilitator family transporter
MSAAPPPKPQTNTRDNKKIVAARLSIASNATLVLLKLIVGITSGSISILSEGFHSASDLLAAGIALMAVRIADLPPDERHPYGHGKAESLSGLAEALLIFVAAGYIVYEAINKIRAPHHATHSSLNIGLLLMAFSAIINTVLSTHLFRIAEQTESLALKADAEHLRTDVITSIGVFVGLLLVRVTENNIFDPLTALVVALFILKTTWNLAKDALNLLLDERLPEGEEGKIRQILDQDSLVLGYHKLRTRKAGAHRYADVHVQIDDNSTLIEAHQITEEIEDKIRAVFPSMSVSIHIEPYHIEMKHQREVHGVHYEKSPPPPS